MANTDPMTQRVELATVRDRLAVDGLVTEYAVAVDDGDWEAYQALFTADGRADYRSAGGIEGSAGAVAGWLAESLGVYPVRQQLFVNRRVRFGIWEQDRGGTARVQADYVNPMCRRGRRGVRRAGCRVRRPVRVRDAAHGRRLAAERGGRTGEVASRSRPAGRTRGPLIRCAVLRIGVGTHTGGSTG